MVAPWAAASMPAKKFQLFAPSSPRPKPASRALPVAISVQRSKRRRPDGASAYIAKAMNYFPSSREPRKPSATIPISFATSRSSARSSVEVFRFARSFLNSKRNWRIQSLGVATASPPSPFTRTKIRDPRARCLIAFGQRSKRFPSLRATSWNGAVSTKIPPRLRPHWREPCRHSCC